jgi:hypothetical protein
MLGTQASHNRESLRGEDGKETMGPSTSEGYSTLRKREDDATSPVNSVKRRKTTEDDYNDDASHVGATELASAFALASLATLSPEGNRFHSLTAESRDVDFGDDDSGSTEMRSPKEDPVPVTPEVRSDSRMSKKVTFSHDTKDIERQGARRFSFPPRSPQASRMPIGFRRGGFAGRAHLAPPLPHPPLPPHPPMHWQISPQRQRMMVPPPGFMPPPHAPSLMATPPQSVNQWICDFCNVASFATYQEACMHEESCSVRCGMASPRRQQQFQTPMWHHPVSPPLSMQIPHHHPMACMEIAPEPPILTKPLPSSASRKWYQGATSLEVPETDGDWLSEINCYIRRECVEAFSATEDQVARTSKRGRITADQVGIRCRFCSHRPVEERPVGAVSFPASVSGIYESVKRWQRVHMEVCEDLPQQVHDTLSHLASSNVWIPTTRQYWVDSAKALGMVDTEEGIRFAEDPYNRSRVLSRSPDPSSHYGMSETADGSHIVSSDGMADGKAIVVPDDYLMVPPYVYFLMTQVEACHFTEADRFVARSKGPVGYPGFQCKHCNGHAGLGKYFPVTSKSLSTNSTSQNIHAHLLKCRKCPPELKRKLVELKEEKSKAPRLEPGWRKVFFDKVWSRLHG